MVPAAKLTSTCRFLQRQCTLSVRLYVHVRLGLKLNDAMKRLINSEIRPPLLRTNANNHALDVIKAVGKETERDRSVACAASRHRS